MPVTWTKEQQRVIRERGKDMLVSAAAGSGKTAVLVERILGKITDEEHPIDIDRLLVVTFTNAAASEMRSRIRDKLQALAEEKPDDLHLQRQLVLVHNAKIMTLHSFCLQVLRNHFQSVGIDPSFRIADEGEVLLLEQDAVREIVDEAYEQNSPLFTEFLEQSATGRQDTEVEEMILQLYHYALGEPYPEKWLQTCRDSYEEPDGEEKETPAWMGYLLQDTALRLREVREKLTEAISLTEEPDGPYPYRKALESDLELVKNLETGSSYETYSARFRHMGSFERLSGKKDERISEEKQQLVKTLRAECKEELTGLREAYFYDDPDSIRDNLQKSGLVVRVLTELTEAFLTRLAEKKAEKNVLDFSDMEHLALRALEDSTVAGEYAETFEEVLTDEYQDINLVQERILQCVSGGGKGIHNRFMVGDVKQSIYRFRLARPELFMEKFRQYREEETKEHAVKCRIDLHQNFRSRRQVLDSVNGIFAKLMTEPLGGITYDEEAALYPGASYPEGERKDGRDEYRTELLVLDAAALDAPGESSDSSETLRVREARMVAERIQSLVGTLSVVDQESGQVRPARYRDVVVLLRTVSGWAELFGEVFAEKGIPCHTGSQKGYFSAAEVRMVLSYLQILDNPLQDIPLAAVLRSAIGKLTDEELAQIRLAGTTLGAGTFYDCCRAYCREHADKIREKLYAFFTVYDDLREKSEHTPVHQLLWEMLEETGYGEYASALPAGRQRKANLDMLAEKAMAYEKTSYRGLYHFVRYIENLQKYEVDYGEADLGAEADDTVRLMSIHKSKGLEFPIVFVCGLGKQFNETDVRSRVVMHSEWGIACDVIQNSGMNQSAPRMREPTLLKKTMQRRLRSESLGEELRVLYVAMTRAKEKLILTGAVRDYEKKLPAWQSASKAGEEEALPYTRLVSASTYLDWVMPACLQVMEEGDITVCAASEDGVRTGMGWAAELSAWEELLQINPSVCCSKKAEAYLRQVFTSSYPFEASRKLPGKLTVSELKKQSQRTEETEARELYPEEEAEPLIPKFRMQMEKQNQQNRSAMGAELETPRTADAVDGTSRTADAVPGNSQRQQNRSAMGAAAKGTVYHRFLQNLDYSRTCDLLLQLEELVDCGKMTREEASVIRLKDVDVFLRSPIGGRIKKAALGGNLYREQPFVLGVSAEELGAGRETPRAADAAPGNSQRQQNRYAMGAGRETPRAADSSSDMVLVQGIIDAYFVEDGAVTVVDYKTDRVSDGQILIDRYRTQLEYYAQALRRLRGLPVDDIVIYSFCLGEEIHLR